MTSRTRALALISTFLTLIGTLLWAEPVPGPAPGRPVLFVYLPELPTAAADDLATASAGLAQALSTARLTFEPKVFRQQADARAWLSAHAAAVSLLLVDPALLLDLPPGLAPRPLARAHRAGRQTHQRGVVVQQQSAARSLLELAGKSLALPASYGEAGTLVVERQVLRGDVSIGQHFSRVETTVDDVEALATMLYGRSDAALVALDNPRLASALASAKVRVVYNGAAVSLPVLATVGSTLSPADISTLGSRIASLPSTAAAALAALGVDGFAPLDRPLPTRQALLSLPIATPPELSPALLDFDLGGFGAPPAPRVAEIAFLLGLALPELPLPSELPTDAGILEARSK